MNEPDITTGPWADKQRAMGRTVPATFAPVVVKPAETEFGQQIRNMYEQTGRRLAVDEDCPGCGWGERWFDGTQFGCNKCDHRGEFRNS